MENYYQQNQQNFDRCLVYLRNSMLRLDDEQFTWLSRDFDHDPLAIRLLISYLEHWHDGKLSGLEYIPVLNNNHQQQERGLKRLLVTFEAQLSGCAELTLLYLLSLSDKPVLITRMERTFQHTFLKRMLSYNSDYQQFLAPLSKLHSRGWDKIIQNLYKLHLLHVSDSAEGQLLNLEERICRHFRENLEVQKYHIMQLAYEDMTLASGTVSAYTLPKASANNSGSNASYVGIIPPKYGLPSPKRSNDNNKPAAKAVDIHGQLRALRYRLRVLKAQSRELNTLMLQSPAFNKRKLSPDLHVQQNSRVA